MAANTVMVGKGTSKEPVDVGGLMTVGDAIKAAYPDVCVGDNRIRTNVGVRGADDMIMDADGETQLITMISIAPPEVKGGQH